MCLDCARGLKRRKNEIRKRNARVNPLPELWREIGALKEEKGEPIPN